MKTNTPTVTLDREEDTRSNTSEEKVTYGERVSEKFKTQMGLVEVVESHHDESTYFTVFLVDIHKSGKRNLAIPV